MKNEEYERSKEELEKAKEQNNQQIAISNEKIRMVKFNSLEYKAGTTFFFSMLAYATLFLTSLCLTKLLGASVIINIFPGFSYPITLICSSIVVGTIVKTLFYRKYDLKKRLKTFSTAKTQAEKLEEEIYYQIELEKANNRNRVIDETIKFLDSNQTILNGISSRYDLNDKTALQSKEESEKKTEKLTTILKEQYDKLDIFTTQKVLNTRFWELKHKFYRRVNTILASMISGIFAMLFGTFPIFMIKDAMPNCSPLTSLAVPLTLLTIGIIGGNTYMLKRHNDYKNAFNNLNNKLGENSLEENLDKRFEEQEVTDYLIEKQIRDISLVVIQLQENKRYLDIYNTEEEKKKDILFEDFQKLRMTEETRKYELEHLDRHTKCDVRTCMEKFNNYEEYEQIIEEKGPTLVKMRKTINLNDKK